VLLDIPILSKKETKESHRRIMIGGYQTRLWEW
jgi:hypothetical protein